VVEGTPLLREHTGQNLYPGFESLRLRQFSLVYSGYIGNGLYRRHGKHFRLDRFEPTCLRRTLFAPALFYAAAARRARLRVDAAGLARRRGGAAGTIVSRKPVASRMAERLVRRGLPDALSVR
jgi:hypothetical protein